MSAGRALRQSLRRLSVSLEFGVREFSVMGLGLGVQGLMVHGLRKL